MSKVGELIRRMDMLIAVLHIAAAHIEIPTAARNAVNQRVDFQNNRLAVLLGKLAQDERA